MKLNLYRRHRPECEARRPWQSRSSEYEERRKDWGRRCACQIHLSGTLDGKFSRKGTGTSDWAEAHRIAEVYEQADSWTGEPKLNPTPLATPLAAEKSRITIEDACQIFITNREAAGIAPATLRKYRTFTKQISTYAESRGYVMLEQFTPDDIDLFWANWKLGARAKGTRLHTLRAFFRFSSTASGFPSRPSALTSRRRSVRAGRRTRLRSRTTSCIGSSRRVTR